MINGLEGIPGSGKSYEASVFQVLEAVSNGRLVITNLPLNVEAFAAIDPAYRRLIEIRVQPAPIRGTWDANRVNPETGQGQAYEAFADGHIDKAREDARLFGAVWCYYSTWKHPITGQGPLFVIDECHVAMPKIGTDKAVIEWYKLHRHFNCDVLLATQKFRQMSQDIAELMAMVIKVRKADVLGRSDSYIRKVHAGYRGEVIQQSVRKYEPAFFKLYKSHTQGNSVLEAGATDVAPISVKIKRVTRGVWLLTAIAMAAAIWYITKPKPYKPPPGGRPDVVKEDGSTDYAELHRKIAEEARRERDAALPKVEPEKPLEMGVKGPPDPYAGKGLHITGFMRMGKKVLYTFAVSASGQNLLQVTSDDLVKIGYRYEPLTDCAGYLRFGSDTRSVICDAPARTAGSPDKPVVLMNGASSDGRLGARTPPVESKPPPMNIS